MTQPLPPDEFFTVRELARRWKCSRDTALKIVTSTPPLHLVRISHGCSACPLAWCSNTSKPIGWTLRLFRAIRTIRID